MNRLLLLQIFLTVGVYIFAQSSDLPFRFALVTDTHIGSSTSEEDLSRTINDINSLSDIAFVILSGDVTEFGTDEELMTAKKLLSGLRKPYYVIPGNHDSNWSESGTNSFKQIFGGETFGFEYGGYKFLGLASGPNMRMGPGQIPRENITWLHEELCETNMETPLIYINHYPMDHSLNNWFEVLDALRPYNVKLMLCGHGHANRPLNFEGANAAMCRSNLRANDTYGGYNIITVSSDSIILQERLVSGETLLPWVCYSTAERPKWIVNPPRPDDSLNEENHFVKKVWSIEEKSDIGGGMALEDDLIIYTNTDGEIKAATTSNGRNVWSYQTKGKIYSTPTVYKGVVWCASTDSCIYGLNVRSGKLLHKLKTDKAIVSSPVCVENKVIVVGGDGHCRAWRVDNGLLVWDFDSVRNFVVTRPLIDDETLFFGSWGNEFYAIDSHNGSLRWKWSSGQTNRMFSPAQVWPVESHGRIYLVSPDRYMTVLDKKTGKVIWRYSDTENRVRESIGISENGNTVYAKTMEGKIIALDATVPLRSVNWISSGENMGYELAPTSLVEKKGLVLVPTDKGLIYAYRADNGSYLWKYRISDALITMILPADNNEIYVSAMDGKLLKLKLNYP
ncbi:metallophosphoesterase [Dysgonamonadaceae bacterium]|nr:metallophosphoesterase [Dysgonamonadaceae bacterium]